MQSTHQKYLSPNITSISFSIGLSEDFVLYSSFDAIAFNPWTGFTFVLT